MNENTSASQDRRFEGNMFLYQQPEALTALEHGKLGLSRIERPFDFVKSVKAMPIAVTEVVSAQKHFPIVFSDLENPVLLAALGIDDHNLFLDADGNWEPYSYVPAYIRCHPLALATNAEGQSIGVVDRAADSVREEPELPFFDGDDLTAETRDRLQRCAELTAEMQRTRVFCERLKELELLTMRQVTHKTARSGDEKVIASFVAVDPDRLKDLDGDVLHGLHKDGWLPAIYAHVFSSENWHYLMQRKTRIESAGSGESSRT